MSSPFSRKHMGKSPVAALLGDLNKDGKMSSYETTRQEGMEKGMKENSSALNVIGEVLNNPENSTSSSGYTGEPGGGTNFYIPGGGQGTGGQSITKGMSQEPVIINAKGSNNNISSGKTRVEHRADKTELKIASTDDAVVKRRRESRLERLNIRAAKKEIRKGKRYARKKGKGIRIDAKFKGGVEGQGGKDYNV